ncbi:hypothetical protein [Rhizobacter sp. Root1221]|uniref:hypothetical protein n=1 Tax=Rhizobacter sp. Root1221 TaxID=1736433 RepID=UPI0007000450|nr:hypothetical protein [Rhizobacter sp. Root1221]KQV94754.1 hypothetical protein ASC87_25935 [Rhizobacter sp. Root1221]
MSLWQREATVVGVGLSGVAWQRGDAPVVHLDAPVVGVAATLLARPKDFLEALCSQLQETLRAIGRPPKRVMLADAFARYWLMSPPAAVVSLGELQHTAAARCSQLFGGSPAEWHVAGDWHATRPFLCTAVPRWTIDMVQQAFGRDPRIDPLLSAVMSALAPSLPSDGWFCLGTPHYAMMASTKAGHIASLRVMPLGAAASAAERLSTIGVELEREAMRHQTPLSDGAVWASLDADDVPELLAGGVTFRRIDHVAAVPAPLRASDAMVAAWSAMALVRRNR